MATEQIGEVEEMPIVLDQEQEAFEKEFQADEKALADSLVKKGIQAPPAKTDAPKTEPDPKAGTEETPKKVDEKVVEDKSPDKELTKYEKAKAREAEAWKKIEAEKAELKAERERIANEKTAKQPAKQQTNEPDSKAYDSYADKRELVYQRLTAKLNKDGELTEVETKEMNRALYDSETAREEAKRLAAHEANQAQNNQQVQQSQEQQNQSWQKAKAEFPEALDKGTPLNIALVDFISKNEDFIRTVPNGPYAATMFVKAQLEASRVPVLEKDLTVLKDTNSQLQKRVEELTAATSLSAGGNGGLSRPSGERSFGQMNTKEMEAYLDREYANT